MSESDVQVIVNDAFSTYERETGKPRHEENTENFKEVFRMFNMLRGVMWTAMALVGIPGCVASILVIISKIRGH